ncbi:MAG: hypothetical protein QOG87_238 [Actinomycetota bacterium]|jgi:hypothetical protein
MTDSRALDTLVGRWTVEGTLPLDPPIDFRGWATFEWLGAFMVYRSAIDDQPDFPSVVAVIEIDDETTGACTQHYFDSRGIKRIYQMRVTPGLWEMWRDGEDDDFYQRFTGKVSADGTTVDGRFDIAEDRKTWKHDFDITYRKVQ